MSDDKVATDPGANYDGWADVCTGGGSVPIGNPSRAPEKVLRCRGCVNCTITRGAERLAEVAGRTREPVAGWAQSTEHHQVWFLRIERVATAEVMSLGPGRYGYEICDWTGDTTALVKDCVSKESAQLAAEDALLAIAQTILRALGRDR